MTFEQRNRHDFRVGLGTPMGDALRRYWTPVCMSSEVHEPDCDPVRVWLLGQSFVVFRDTAGQVGVLDEACPHRKVSLVYGRNEDGGIRCLWHQWKIATDGTILESPNNDDCRFRERIRANAYDVVEAGGFVWGYFGPKEHRPPEPWLPWFDLPESHVMIVPCDLDSHFVHNVEGLVDSSHAPLLHVDGMNIFTPRRTEERDQFVSDSSPQLDIVDTDFGFRYAAIRNVQGGGKSVRVTTFVAPYLALIPTPDQDGQCHMFVPRDDGHSRMYNVFFMKDHPLTQEEYDYHIRLFGLSDELLDKHGMRATMPGPGPLGRSNHLVQDRAAMKRGDTFTGHMGLTAEDAAMTGSIPGMSDYRGENLVPADLAVVRLRRMMVEIQQKVSADETPPGANPPVDRLEMAGKILHLENGREWRKTVKEVSLA